jgi:hypothetical protein
LQVNGTKFGLRQGPVRSVFGLGRWQPRQVLRCTCVGCGGAFCHHLGRLERG